MRRGTIRTWSRVHSWTSLLCTLFLLMLCLTGLPLIFHDEIDAALNPDAWSPANPEGPRLALDDILDVALAQRAGEVPIFMSFDVDRPVVNVTTGPTADAPASAMYFASYDATSGDLVPPADRGEGVMHFLLQLHTDLFLGLPGMLFLGAMGVLFLASVISGVVLYAPFMRKLDFATVRRGRTRRIRRLDWHNLLGIVTVAWVLVVGVTGVVNTLEKPIIDAWKFRELADLVTPLEGRPPPTRLASLDAAVRQTVQEAPDMTLQFVAFPGSSFSTAQHYAIFLHGRTPATEHIIMPALVNAESGRFEGLREMPWWVKALSLSRPLHFGDYGGLALKVVWALLDLATIYVLISGLYLWRKKVRQDAAARRPLAEAA